MGHQPDPHRWLASGDVFLHAAVGEAFGNVLVEALGCGLPVVATASGAAGELIAEGRTGRLVAPDAPGDSVEPGDNEVERLATAVQQVTGDRGRYGEVSRAAALAAQQFTTDLCVERTMQVYAPWLAAGEKQEPCV
jgi:glycosyltransferase involved in cell wall biosynthesis